MATLDGVKAIANALGITDRRRVARLLARYRAPCLIEGKGAGARYTADAEALAAWWQKLLSTHRRTPARTDAHRRTPSRTRRR